MVLSRQPKFLIWFFGVVGVLLIAGILTWLLIPRGANGPAANIAEIRLYLKDGLEIEDIKNDSKDIKYSGNRVEIKDGSKEMSFSDVELKGRGNSTWGLPKSPYQIELPSRADILGLGNAKKWILLANYVDPSNLRNDVAYKIAEMLNERFAVRGRFAMLFIDDGYEGLYFVTNKVEIDRASVDLKDYYGVLVEMDNLHGKQEDYVKSQQGVRFVLKDAVAKNDEDAVKEAMEQFLESYNQFEQVVRAKDYQKITELIDIKSFAEYYLINEFSTNPDIFATSFFLYKDGEKDKIHAGPAWDFDYAFGNFKWIWGDIDKVHSPYETMAMRGVNWKENDGKGSYLDMYYLMEIPEFRDEVRRLFREKMSGKKDELIDFVKAEKDLIFTEANNNADRWVFDDFATEADYLIDWIAKRYDYFERVYGREEYLEIDTKN